MLGKSYCNNCDQDSYLKQILVEFQAADTGRVPRHVFWKLGFNKLLDLTIVVIKRSNYTIFFAHPVIRMYLKLYIYILYTHYLYIYIFIRLNKLNNNNIHISIFLKQTCHIPTTESDNYWVVTLKTTTDTLSKVGFIFSPRDGTGK